MKHAPALIVFAAVLAVSATALPAPAQENAGSVGGAVVKVVQSFYDGYMKLLTASGDTESYVLKSASITPAFKKAYRAHMKEPDFDPIICGQDYPDAGFTATDPKVTGATATVSLTSRDAQFPHSFTVTLKRGEKGGWQIDSTRDLKPSKG